MAAKHVFDAGADGVAPIKLLFEVVETAKGYRPRILVRYAGIGTCRQFPSRELISATASQ